jgi:thioredoxin reductase (NADPH)
LSEADQINVAVIGGGLAGAAAVMTAAELGATVALVEPLSVGGEVINLDEVHGLPGGDAVSGPDLVASLMERVMATGVDFRLGDTAVALEPTGDGWLVQTEMGALRAGAVALCSGAGHAALPGRPDIDDDPLYGAGLFTCAPCDAAMYAGRRVAVVGGGDTGADAAVTLSAYAREVVVFERRSELQCRPPARERLAALPNVEVRCANEVTGLSGDAALRAVELAGGEAEPVDGAMLAVGLRPRSGLAAPHAELDEDGAVVVAPDLLSTAPGLYAAGDVRAGSPYRCGAAWGDGVTAATAAVAALRATSGVAI